MEAVQKEQERLEKKANLKKSIEDVQSTIDLLVKARNTIAADPSSASVTVAKLQNPVKQSFDKVIDDLKEVYTGINRYGKALDRVKIKDKPLPTQEHDALSAHPFLINRAIAMHLLREGQFSVASTFISEANSNPLPAPPPFSSSTRTPSSNDLSAWDEDFAHGALRSESLQRQFAEMYHILSCMRHQHNLTPAIDWARKHSTVLEARGSNLEFELCRLQFVILFTSSPSSGPLLAWQYAKQEFGTFQQRYARETQQLLGALAFHTNLAASPYARLFQPSTAWEEVSSSFTREFCSLLGLSSSSPLYTAATAGAIALPTLLKLQQIMKEKRTEWTSQNELPVEIPLPPAYHFHSIFVCPVSKEQGTDENPPMMMPCGHVIAKESLERVSKGARFKCPYCPNESHPRDAKKVIL